MREFLGMYKPSNWNVIQWMCFIAIACIVGAHIFAGKYWDAAYHAVLFVAAAETGRRL